MKKAARDLTAGDQILPPAHERKWLKTPLTVVSVSIGSADKGGPWLHVRASFVSPYGERTSESIFRFRPNTAVTVLSR
jgi:hypothetical protein